MNGRAIRDHLSLAALPLADALDVFTSYAVDDETARTTVQVAEDRAETLTRRRARETLAGVGGRRSVPAAPVAPSIDDADPGTWGLLPEHRAGMVAAMAFAGPAAPKAGP